MTDDIILFNAFIIAEAAVLGMIYVLIILACSERSKITKTIYIIFTIIILALGIFTLINFLNL